MARNTRFSDKINNSRVENTTLTTAEQVQQREWELAGGEGYYQKASLEDMIDQFIIAYTGSDKVLSKIPRHEVAFWAQRAVQEFSYDVLYAELNIELAINPDTLSVALPSDYVNYVKVTWADANGTERTLHPARVVNGKQAVLQDDDYKQLYDNTGEKLLQDRSVGLERYQSDNNEIQAFARNYYYGSVYDGDFYDFYYNSFYGRRYGNDPQFENYNGTFVLDTYKGMLYLDSSFASFASGSATSTTTNASQEQREIILSLRYISDGLGSNDDLADVRVHKFAEDAIYSSILYNAVKVRPTVANLAPLYKKEAKAKLNNAKIRLMNLKSEEIAQVMRGKAKWIKH